MKIIDGIKLQGRPAEIPDCSRDDLPQFFKEMGYKVGAEIGVLRGEFTEKLCQPGLKIYAIDAWRNYLDYHKHPREEPYEVMYEMTKKRLAPYDCAIVRKLSMEAAEGFKANSLDFVYIDGNHKLRHIIDDIYEWSLRVRSGGAICGHDYELNNRSPHSHYACHVKYAVDLYAQIWSIPNWYLLGRKRAVEGEKRDKHRSWLWLKP
jgi:hypothetical protein